MAESAAVHAAAIAQAIKASGVVVRVEPANFQRILNQQDEPIVVCARGGFFRIHWRYLTTYKGLAFFTMSPDPLPLPGRAQPIHGKPLLLPGQGAARLFRRPAYPSVVLSLRLALLPMPPA